MKDVIIKTVVRNLAQLDMDDMAKVIRSANSSCCIDKKGRLSWIAYCVNSHSRNEARQTGEFAFALDIAKEQGCNMILWNRTAPLDDVPLADKRPFGMAFVCLGPTLFVQKVGDTRFYYLEFEEENGAARIYHGCVDLHDVEVKKEIFASNDDAAEVLWFIRRRTTDIPYYELPNANDATAFLKWWMTVVPRKERPDVR